ncbi:MAG: sugar phosphate isomerase/epimerase family protein [Acidobacteriota bacterium]
MKIGMNTLLWTTQVTEKHFPLLEELKQAGFDGVEIYVGQDDPHHYQEINRELLNLGLECTTVIAVDGETNPISPDSRVRRAAVERLKRAIEMSNILGSQVLCGPFHSALGVFSGEGPRPEEERRCAEVLRQAAAYAKRLDLVLAVEHLSRFDCYLLNTTAQCRNLVRRVGHPALRLLYDTHHAHIEEQRVSEAIEGAAAEIGHVHLSENDRGVPGRGQVNWVESFRSLHRIAYDRWLVIESFSRLDPGFASAAHIWRDCFSSPEEVYREGIAFVRKMWNETAL